MKTAAWSVAVRSGCLWCCALSAVAIAQQPGVQEAPPPSAEGFDALEQNSGAPRINAGSPFTPAAQNFQQAPLGSPFTPGPQNNSGNFNSGSPFAPGNQNQSSVWPNQNNPFGPLPPQEGGMPTPPNNDWARNLPRPEDPKFMPLPPNYSNLPIRISMPEGQPGACGYQLATGQQAWNYMIAPGKSQTFVEDRVWQVTYDRGGGFGPQTYTLRSGHYKFRQSPRGWELYRGELDPSIAAPVATTPPPVAVPAGPAPPGA